jgi:hypothetical protein
MTLTRTWSKVRGGRGRATGELLADCTVGAMFGGGGDDVVS